MTLGLAEKISFSKEIDSIVDKHKDQPNIYIQTKGNLIQSLLAMLVAERIDYTIAYPWMVEYFAQEMGQIQAFKVFTIQENPSPIIYYAACPKNEWGMQMAKEIDAILRTIRPTDSYRQIMERWMIQETLPAYRYLYNNVFLPIE